MAETDVTVASAVAKRLSHMQSLDWEIRTVETADPHLAEEQAEVLRYAYEQIEKIPSTRFSRHPALPRSN